MKINKTVKSFCQKLSGRAVTLLVVGAVLAPAAAGAATLVSQSYQADSALPSGTIVSLKSGTSDQVTASTLGNASDIFGVVVNADSSQLSISGGNGTQVSVAQNGLEPVSVSDINGKITPGDSITSSPINGVGMKATDNAKVIGVAQDSFPNTTARKATYKEKSGQQQSVNLGQVQVLVSVAYYYKQPDKTIVPQALQNLANSLAGRKVNTLPIIISVAIFIVTLVLVVSIVYSLIHSSIISVGRNPMSQAAVYRNVIQLSALVIIILGVAVGAIYMVLAKF